MVRSERTDGNIFLRVLIGVFTVLLILMCSFGTRVNAAQTTDNSQSTDLPAVGDEVHGFKIVSIEPINLLGAQAVLFKHEKSGAQLLYIACDDENRAFDITFQTPALDNKGKPHVFEHITICGSQKYKDPNLFFPFYNNTYNTFVNAYTYHCMTSFPVASLSEKQLKVMMDYYLSGVFEPLLYTDKNLASREAWRYEIADADSPITIAGTVYSEMQGVYNLSAWANYYDMTNLFEGSPVAYESGGFPDAIRTLTYEELVNFHDTYYKPSNSLITLYGKLDYDSFLSFIDSEYLSKYDNEEVYVEKGKITPFTSTHYKTCEAPVEAGTDTENSSYIYYSYGASDATISDYEDLTLLASLLSSESSGFMTEIRKQLPQINVFVYASCEGPVPQITFRASNANESDRDTFVKIVDSSIEKIVKNGLSKEETAPVLSKAKLINSMITEDSNLGVDVACETSLFWTSFGSLDYYNVVEDRLNTVTNDDLTSAAKKWLYDNKYRAVTVTVPKPGLSEANNAKLENELTALKASMTESQINQMVNDYNSHVSWSEAEASDDIVSKFSAVSVSDLNEKLTTYDTTDITTDGIRWMSADVNSNDAYQTEIRIDASGISIDKLQDVKLYLSLLGNLGTSEYSREGLSLLTDQYLTGFYASLSSDECISGDDNYYARFSWRSLGDNTAMSSALLAEIINNTDLTDTKAISEILTRDVNSFSQTVDSAAYYIQSARCKATYSVPAAFSEYLTDYDFDSYSQEMILLAQNDPQELTKRLSDAKELILNRKNLIVISTGDGNAINSLKTDLTGFLNSLPEKEITKTDYSPLLLNFKNEALINNSSVHMNFLVGPNNNFSGKDYAIAAFLDDKFMLPQFRNVMGAYGAYSAFGDSLFALYTYRDPNLDSTFNTMEKIPQFLRTTDISQDEVDRYIVGCYSSLIDHSGPMTDSMTQIEDELCGKTTKYNENILHEVKQTKVKDIRSAADEIENLLKNGVRSTSGTSTAIQNSGMSFDSIKN